MSRNVCIAAVDGQTGFLIAELLMTDKQFSSKVDSVCGLSLHPTSAKCKELQKLGVTIIPHKPGKVKEMAATLKDSGADALCIIPPTHKDKFDITMELVTAGKRAGVPNVCLVSSAGADMADAKKQPRLREFIDIEQLVMEAKGDAKTQTGHSPVVVRAGFYAENLLNYGPQLKEGTMPLPIGPNHKFAPIALGDVALVVAHVLSGKGQHGFDDKHRGQLIVLTGPMMGAGEELAEAAKQALGVDMQFEDISEAEAKRVLHAQAPADASEIQYLLEYYSLVREGKTNYISTCAFHDITGQHPQELVDFFKVYADEFKPEHANKKRKMNGK
ncbi:Prestalk A differentiation protein A [Lachnellula occidentalis]|uniref:Prestalk A differentiation protein A n=1 Tax=Lachnellula occidentalis TaxID=215460 RepID=A0A8H8S521_9HELO|nr:Prestalk A differentiation protein A [Lachnellula occidentalis]